MSSPTRNVLARLVRNAALRTVLVGSFAVLVGCATPEGPKPPGRSPAEVRAQLVTLLPAQIEDRAGWARDVQMAFELLDVPPSTENLCAALAVTEQESTFTVDPEVPGLAKIARAEIDSRAARLKIPQLLVRAALRVESPNGQRYGERIAKLRTEHQVSQLFDEFINKVPMGQRLFGGANPVRTGGPMQVSIAFAEAHAGSRDYPYADRKSIREEVFTRRGGMYFGIAHLLDFPSSYSRHLHRFADFNAGWYASRNAAFQAAVTQASGIKLARDGDLIIPERGRDRVGATEAAVRTLSSQLALDHAQIRRALEMGNRFEFEQSELYQRVFAIAERKLGAPLPRAVVPTIALQSPKFTRKLTTEWFATRVQQRYQRCVNKAFGV